MEYVKKEFKAGDILSALDLNNIGDGIEEAIGLAQEAASQGAQADYNENDSASASYIKNRPFYEGYAYEPITWDGVVGDRESADVSHLIGSEAGTVFMVKLSDNDKLMTEDYIGSTITAIASGKELTAEVTENDVISAEQANAWGMYGQIRSIVTVFDISLANSSLGVNLQSSGTYGFYSEVLSQRVKSISKTVIKKIDEKFLPELASGANMEKGTGVGATQQIPDGVADGFDFTDKNANANTLDHTLTGIIPYGATGTFACAFGGKCAAMGKRSHAEGTTTIAKGDYSHTEGNATVTLGVNSHAEGAITTAFGGTSHAEGRRTLAHGEASHAEGVETEAHGEASHAEGVKTEAHGGASHAEGELTKTCGYSSHAEGGFTETGKENDENLNGLYAHAEGAHTKAYGQISHAEGVNTEATGYASHVGGMNTIADQSAQTVIGKFNDPNAVRAYSDPRGGSLFQIGIGSSDTDRKNAINILGNGDIVLYFNGEYYSLNKIIDTLGGFKDDTKVQD